MDRLPPSVRKPCWLWGFLVLFGWQLGQHEALGTALIGLSPTHKHAHGQRAVWVTGTGTTFFYRLTHKDTTETQGEFTCSCECMQAWLYTQPVAWLPPAPFSVVPPSPSSRSPPHPGLHGRPSSAESLLHSKTYTNRVIIILKTECSGLCGVINKSLCFSYFTWFLVLAKLCITVLRTNTENKQTVHLTCK